MLWESLDTSYLGRRVTSIPRPAFKVSFFLIFFADESDASRRFQILVDKMIAPNLKERFNINQIITELEVQLFVNALNNDQYPVLYHFLKIMSSTSQKWLQLQQGNVNGTGS